MGHVPACRNFVTVRVSRNHLKTVDRNSHKFSVKSSAPYEAPTESAWKRMERNETYERHAEEDDFMIIAVPVNTL